MDTKSKGALHMLICQQYFRTLAQKSKWNLLERDTRVLSRKSLLFCLRLHEPGNLLSKRQQLDIVYMLVKFVISYLFLQSIAY